LGQVEHLRDVEELLADGVHDGLHPRVQLELLQDVAHVVLHSVLADEQLTSGITVVQALRHQIKDFELAVVGRLVLSLVGNVI
jgi:hypothetical protein